MSRAIEVFNRLSALSLCFVHEISAGVTFYSVILVLDTYLSISVLDVLSVFSITCSYSLALKELKIYTSRQTDARWLADTSRRIVAQVYV
jgi:hypothetical protein